MTHTHSDGDNLRILILLPTGRDAELAEEALARRGLSCQVCAELDNLRHEIGAGAGVALIAEETLQQDNADDPEVWIGPEPSWSSLPLVVLTGRRVSSRSRAALRRVEQRANVSFLERPVPKRTLISTLRAAIEDRRRQYAVRDLLRERMQAEQAAHERETRLRLALEGAAMGAWDWDMHTNGGSWDARQYEVCGFSPGDESAPLGSAFFRIVHPEDRGELQRVVDAAVGNAEDYRHEFRIVRPDGEVRWLAGRGRVIEDDNGRPVRMVGVNWDITEDKQTDLERKRLIRQVEDQFNQLQALYDAAPIGLALLDRELRFQRINPVLAEMNGRPVTEHLGKLVWEVVPDLQGAAEPALQKVFETGEPMTEIELRGETPAQPGVRRNWIEKFYPLKATDGTVEGIGVIVEDVTERKRAEEQQALLTAELHHRVKNMLSTVQGTVMQTLKSADSMEAFAEALSGRLQALARGQDILIRGQWQPTEMSALLRNALAPFEGECGISLGSSDIWLRPEAALAFNLIVHELATNATKYGAMSVPEGRIQIDCQRFEDQPGMAAFSWIERGGPSLKPPRRRGFGSKLIKRCAKYELSGAASFEYRPEGLECVIRFVTEELSPAAGDTK